MCGQKKNTYVIMCVNFNFMAIHRELEERTVARLEVPVDDFNGSFCMEVMHSCGVNNN